MIQPESIQWRGPATGLQTALQADLGLDVPAADWLRKEPALGDEALLARIDPERRTLRTWRSGVELPFGEVRAILPEAGPRAWIGTYGGGLVRVEDTRCTPIDERHGLLDQSLCAVLPRGDELFLASNSGLYVLLRSALEDVAAERTATLACRPLQSGGPGAAECEGGLQPCASEADGKLGRGSGSSAFGSGSAAGSGSGAMADMKGDKSESSKAFAAANHNGMLRMYEVFNQGGANTKKARLQGGQTTRQWYRPNPAPAGEVDWSIRNSINYAQTGLLTALELTSKFPTMVVENYYKKSANAMRRGADKPPHAFVIPGGQRDQTQVDRVLPKYHEWLGKSPSFAVLAEATPAEDRTMSWHAYACHPARSRPGHARTRSELHRHRGPGRRRRASARS